MDTLIDWLGKARDLLDIAVIETDDTRITLWSVLYVLFFVVVLFWFAGWLQRWLARGPLTRTALDAGSRQAVATVARYLLLLVGLLVILQSSGLDLTTFNVFAGAVGIGVGFGLQNVVSNFISGLIIMFERPIKIGDRIVVDQVEGEVIEIGARATSVLTNDNIAIIVPNSKFITENVVNWQYNDSNVRFHVPVSVAYGSDAGQVEGLLLEVAKENKDVLEDPPPAVRLLEFGDNGLAFELRAWSSSLVHRKGQLVSALNRAIYDKFNEAGIAFPFPQRDLQVRGGVLEVRQAKSAD